MELSLSSRVGTDATEFLRCVSFFVVLLTIWPYLSGLGSTFTLLVIVLCVYSAGEAISIMIFVAFVKHYTVRCLMLMTNTLGIVGAFLYVVAQLFEASCKPRTFILLGSTLLGAWSGGGQSIRHAYLAENVTPLLLTSVVQTLSEYGSLRSFGGLTLE